MTLGWPRGGGSHMVKPAEWPKIGGQVVKRRSVPWNYFMNVCTHSYSLVWYDWAAWEKFLDWMALRGINNYLALTGQEEIQYKVFQKFGLSDQEIRSWFNGPAFLTWSRGQNEYGSSIAGPLPRSWMQSQWDLQKSIVARNRELGIIGQLPGFQGNAPAGLAKIKQDSNITVQGATGWIDAIDPTGLFGEIADEWMKTLIEDFGTDHWYQLDGYFDGGTAPWLSRQLGAASTGRGNVDAAWYKRGKAVWESLNRTDPEAMWSYQGFAWQSFKDTAETAAAANGFVQAVPKGRFNVIDMAYYDDGLWQKWNESAFFGANFIWANLHNFGGTDGTKGDVAKIFDFPFEARDKGHDNIWGTGFSSEGIDQNPAYYDLMIDQPWRSSRGGDVATALVARAHKRYNLRTSVPDVDAAWTLLAESVYAGMGSGVQDPVGIGHFPGSYSNDWSADGKTPTDSLCKTYHAWGSLIDAADKVDSELEPFRYDLVDTGREVLAHVSTPLSIYFHSALSLDKNTPDAGAVNTTGTAYVTLLHDLDSLLGTDQAFLLGSWINMARGLAVPGKEDCAPGTSWPTVQRCADFLEWNARVQVTTWIPTPQGAAKIPDGPNEYATKHWQGLTGDYNGARAQKAMEMALEAAAQKQTFTTAAFEQMEATHAYDWSVQLSVKYPDAPVGDAVAVSRGLFKKYSQYFQSCPKTASPQTKLFV